MMIIFLLKLKKQFGLKTDLIFHKKTQKTAQQNGGKLFSILKVYSPFFVE